MSRRAVRLPEIEQQMHAASFAPSAQPPISVERADTEVRRIGDMLPFQPRNRQESESPHHRTSTIATLLTPLQAR